MTEIRKPYGIQNGHQLWDNYFDQSSTTDEARKKDDDWEHETGAFPSPGNLNNMVDRMREHKKNKASIDLQSLVRTLTSDAGLVGTDLIRNEWDSSGDIE